MVLVAPMVIGPALVAVETDTLPSPAVKLPLMISLCVELKVTLPYVEVMVLPEFRVKSPVAVAVPMVTVKLPVTLPPTVMVKAEVKVMVLNRDVTAAVVVMAPLVVKDVTCTVYPAVTAALIKTEWPDNNEIFPKLEVTRPPMVRSLLPVVCRVIAPVKAVVIAALVVNVPLLAVNTTLPVPPAVIAPLTAMLPLVAVTATEPKPLVEIPLVIVMLPVEAV